MVVESLPVALQMPIYGFPGDGIGRDRRLHDIASGCAYQSHNESDIPQGSKLLFLLRALGAASRKGAIGRHEALPRVAVILGAIERALKEHQADGGENDAAYPQSSR